MGSPDPERICTSIVERSNLSIRMGTRRFTRLTNEHLQERAPTKAGTVQPEVEVDAWKDTNATMETEHHLHHQHLNSNAGKRVSLEVRLCKIIQEHLQLLPKMRRSPSKKT